MTCYQGIKAEVNYSHEERSSLQDCLLEIVKDKNKNQVTNSSASKHLKPQKIGLYKKEKKNVCVSFTIIGTFYKL